MLKPQSGNANDTVSKTETPSWLAGGRVPCLDGLRALSIVLVLFSHLAPTADSPFPTVVQRLAPRFGSYGVDVFFVISGFLITLLLFREEKRTGRVSLRAFYERRAFRILPAYLAYLGFMLLLTLSGAVYLRPINWAAALTYTTNFLPHFGDESVWLGHTWSLSVEEHFYLLWPPSLVLLGSKRARSLLILLFATTPLIRGLIWGMHNDWLDIEKVTVARMDTIAAGCLLAYLVTQPRGLRWMSWLERRGTVVFLVAVMVVVASACLLSHSGKYVIFLKGTVESITIGIGILALVSCPRSSIARLLETKPMVLLGVLSYSIYIWQQPFLNPVGKLWICRWPQNFMLAATTASVSYILIERPFLRIKDRIGDRRSRKRPLVNHGLECQVDPLPITVPMNQRRFASNS